MAQAGVGDGDANAVQIAVGEATGNAVEHAYAGEETGLVRLIARVDPDRVLHIQVIDGGHWRSAQEPGDNRGRGIGLMRSTMEDVQIQRRDDGTTVRMRLTLDDTPS